MEVEKAETAGLTLLGVGTAFSIWSALNTSPLGHAQYACANAKNLRVARSSMLAGMALVAASAGGLALLYGKKGAVPAAATAATGVGLFAVYEAIIRHEMTRRGVENRLNPAKGPSRFAGNGLHLPNYAADPTARLGVARA